MSDINNFVMACLNNDVSEVRQMISAVNINARHSISGWPGLYIAMAANNKEIVAILLACRDIMLDTAHSSNGMTGLHAASDNNSVECARLFLAHPACTTHIVTMLDKDGQTAEMRANTMGNQDCVRIIKEFIDKEKNKENKNEKTEEDIPRMIERLRLGDVGVADVNPVRLERMTMAELEYGIDKITVLEPVMEAAKKTLESEHRQEVDKQQLKMNSILERQDQEKNSCNTYWMENKNKKQALQAELQRRLGRSPPSPQVAQHAPPLASLIPECPICMESMRPPLQIFSCSNGHLICSICKPRMTSMNRACHCKEMYTGRATAMEQMIRQILGIM